MIQYVEIKGTKYPFKFGMRELYTLTQRANIEDTEAEFDEIAKKVSMDFDAFLELFHLASKKGARLHKKENDEEAPVLSEQEIEDFIDDDPSLFENLNAMFEKANTVKELEKKGDKKKTD